MSNTIVLKRSAVPANVPSTSQLSLGEVAINTYDGKLYIKKDNGTESIVEIGGGGLPSQTGNSGKFLTTDGTNASWNVIVNDASTTSTTLGWSASKLNTTLGDISSALAAILG